MRKEIVLPPHLYDRIKASAGEHGGIGRDAFFSRNGEPQCAHGHAWGTECRMKEWMAKQPSHFAHPSALDGYVEPELRDYLQWFENDRALTDGGYGPGTRVSFAVWCELLNVKRGPDSPKPEATQEAELETACR